MKKFKGKLYKILEVSGDRNSVSWIFDIVLITVITLNALAIILESVEGIEVAFRGVFEAFEVFSVIFFSIEYLLRLWTITENPRFRHFFTGRVKFIFTPMALVDLLAVLPFYLSFVGIDLRFIRLMRVFRIFRLLKIARYTFALKIIGQVMKDKKEELLISLAFIAFMLVIVSSFMYFIENEAQPDAFASIPETMWWGVATLTTVGYGDVYPITSLGRFLGGVISVLGIGLFALPTGILASGFAEVLQNKHKKSSSCPHCGKELDE